MSQENNPIFTFDTTNPEVVSLALSETGKDLVGENTASVFDDLVENIDQSLRNAGYMYNIDADIVGGTITIRSFENVEAFNQEVFDIIAEELLFTDNLLRDGEDTDIEDEDEE